MDAAPDSEDTECNNLSPSAALARSFPDWPHDFSIPPAAACETMGKLSKLGNHVLMTKLNAMLMLADAPPEPAELRMEQVVTMYHPLLRVPRPHPDPYIAVKRHALKLCFMSYGVLEQHIPEVHKQMFTMDWWMGSFEMRFARRAEPLSLNELKTVEAQVQCDKDFQPIRALAVGKLLIAAAAPQPVTASYVLQAVAAKLQQHSQVVSDDSGSDCDTCADMPEQRHLGNEAWTVVSIGGSNSVHQNIKQLKASDADRQRISQLEANAAEDALLWGKCLISNAASEALLFACGDQPEHPGKSKRFDRMLKAKDSRLAKFASSLPFPAQPQLMAPILDDIITRPNVTVHYESEEQLFEKAVEPAQKLLARYPALGDACKQEALVIRCYKELREAFKF